MDDPLYSLPPAFFFRVSFNGDTVKDTSFSMVQGIESELDTEPYAELNEHRFEYALPVKVIHKSNLVLKRGVADSNSPLVTWCCDVLDAFLIPIVTKTITVSLLNAAADPVRSWQFNNAYPVKWTVEDFDANKNELAIETIEFAYTYCQRIK